MAAPVRYLKRFAHRFFEAVGAAAIVLGLIALFAPVIFEDKWWIIPVVAIGAAGWAWLTLRRREALQAYRENVTIRLVVGDLFEQGTSAMVGMTSTFDTSVPDVIAENSVQGSFLKSVYGGSQGSLDTALDAALAGIIPVGTINKLGKQTIYPIATVAVLPTAGRTRYYCAAYTTLDQHNKATGSIRGVLDSLDNVWDQVDLHSNGAPISVPVIGQGQSRIPELTAEISIRLIAFSFLLRSKRSRFSSELRIVVHPTERDKIDLGEFQAFLTSLVTS